MCIFSGKVAQVGGTSIFCTSLGDEHATVYEMSATVETELAMLLPVPVRLGASEDDLRFVNLEDYRGFFADMKKLWDDPVAFASDSIIGNRGMAKGLLRVQDVGAYEASFAPTMADLDRLDPRFKLPKSVFDMLPDYDTFGFAVFKLKEGRGSKRFHPMAYAYPAEDRRHLFFPTVHVHDGTVESVSEYDHRLYFQHGNEFGPVAGWEVSDFSPSQVMRMDKSAGLLRPSEKVSRLRVVGEHDNCDHVLVTGQSGCSVSLRKARV
jgi:hypothetical protein